MLNFENAQDESMRMQKKIENNEVDDFGKAEEEINRENVAKIEKLNIGSSFKAEIMLISLGLKKSTDLSLAEHNDSKEDVKNILSEVGLLSRIKENKGDFHKNVVVTLTIAQDETTLDRLDKAEAYEDHEEYGKLMSFPESAVNAFVNKELQLEDADYPSMKGIIFPLKLSKENYQEEVELLREWSEAIKKYSPDTYNELSGNSPGADQRLQKYLSGLLEIDIEDAEKIRFSDADEFMGQSKYYQEQYEQLDDNRLENVKIGIVPDEIWQKGNQPTESLADDFIILVNEKYLSNNDKPDEIAWLLHELAHCKYYIDHNTQEKYEEDREIVAFEDIDTEVYPNNLIEKYTFTEQFKFLKDQGGMRVEVVGMLKEYYKDKTDFLFFDKLLDEVYKKK